VWRRNRSLGVVLHLQAISRARPELQDVCWRQPAGQAQEPARLPRGWHVIRGSAPQPGAWRRRVAETEDIWP
jgi:hypothetical protein